MIQNRQDFEFTIILILIQIIIFFILPFKIVFQPTVENNYYFNNLLFSNFNFHCYGHRVIFLNGRRLSYYLINYLYNIIRLLQTHSKLTGRCKNFIGELRIVGAINSK